MWKQIKLTKGKITKVDLNDFKYLNTIKWHYNHGYVSRTIRLKNNKFKKQLMHRVIMKAPKSLQVDHINGNTLDNRRINLRLCTKSQNMRNQRISKNNTSGYKGVSWNKRAKKWVSYIRFNSKQYFLGNFKNIKKAARAYNVASKKYHKEFSNLNKGVGRV